LSKGSLGKLIGIHATAPVFLQRAAVVAILSFVFLTAILIAFYIRQHFGYFLLSAAFLIVYVFTMIGWWMQKRNTVELYENGFIYRKSELLWNDVKSVELDEGSGLSVVKKDGEKIIIPRAIDRLEPLTAIIRKRLR
jgi:hypothetical protein